MRCPACGCVDVGRVGSNQFYCWNCFLEFSINSRQQVKFFYVQEDGNLLQLNRPEERFMLEEAENFPVGW